ncbi:MAG: FAD-dependent monooxygenase, partial [Burkholderiales bacterium]|nr:FAD-dependent monooxygenase [Burkholderiales bacterium]
MTRKPLNIAICGYGTAAQAAALFLRAQGHAIRIFERSPVLSPVGAGFLLQPTGLAVLRSLGIAEQALACGARIECLHGQNVQGRQVMNIRYADLGKHLHGLGMQRGALFEILKNAYPEIDAINTGVDIARLDAIAGTLTDHAGNTHGPYDLILVADGAHSNLRRQFPHLVKRDQRYPWGALWCSVEDRIGFSRGVLEQRYRASSEMLGILPVGRLPGDTESTKRVTLYWSVPRDSFVQFEQQPIERWRDKVCALFPEAEDFAAQITHPSQLARGTYRDVVMRRSREGRVQFIGDAVHAMSPQLGQGANMALLDAWTLAQCLQREATIDIALKKYSALRSSHIGIYQLISRWLTPLFQSHSRVGSWLRDTTF